MLSSLCNQLAKVVAIKHHFVLHSTVSLEGNRVLLTGFYSKTRDASTHRRSPATLDLLKVVKAFDIETRDALGEMPNIGDDVIKIGFDDQRPGVIFRDALKRVFAAYKP